MKESTAPAPVPLPSPTFVGEGSPAWWRCDGGEKDHAAWELWQPLWGREARSQYLNPSPRGPEPRESHNAKDVILNEMSTP